MELSATLWAALLLTAVLSDKATAAGTSAPTLSLTEYELQDMVSEMRSYDTRPQQYYSNHFNWQSHVSTLRGRAAPEGLFSYLDPNVYRANTYRELIALKPLYKPTVTVYDGPTPARAAAVDNFLESVNRHPSFQVLAQVLRRKRYPLAGTWAIFKQALHKMWFAEYARADPRILSSSGFEHVFMGELNSSHVLGLHNWVIYSLRETDGSDAAIYSGYVKKRTVVVDDCEVTIETMERRGGQIEMIYPSISGELTDACVSNFESRKRRAQRGK